MEKIVRLQHLKSRIEILVYQFWNPNQVGLRGREFHTCLPTRINEIFCFQCLNTD